MNNIRALRKKNNMTQTDLAKLLNTTTSNISGWECEKWQPDNKALVELAKIFNVSVDELLGVEDEITPAERAQGAREAKRIYISPLEDELLFAFRKLNDDLKIAALRAVFALAGEDWRPL